MVTLTFEFNEDKVKDKGTSVKEIMKPIREYLFSYGAKEIEPYKFETKGENAVSIFTSLVLKITKSDIEFIDLLDNWILDSEGEISDCIEDTRKWYLRKGMKNIA